MPARPLRTTAAILTASVLLTGAAFAQTTVPEKLDAAPPAGGTLSDKLERSGGVITPPTNVDPGITAPAPVPNPGTTPVIPPVGTPGGNQNVQPK